MSRATLRQPSARWIRTMAQAMGSSGSAPSGSRTRTSAHRAARRRPCSSSCAAPSRDYLYLVGDIVDGWQLQAPLVLAPGAQRRDPEDPAQGAQGHLGRLRSGQPRRGGAALPRARVRRHRRSARRRSTRRPTASVCWSPTATSSTAWSSARAGSHCLATRSTRSRSSSTGISMRCADASGCPTGRCRNT